MCPFVRFRPHICAGSSLNGGSAIILSEPGPHCWNIILWGDDKHTNSEGLAEVAWIILHGPVDCKMPFYPL